MTYISQIIWSRSLLSTASACLPDGLCPSLGFKFGNDTFQLSTLHVPPLRKRPVAAHKFGTPCTLKQKDLTWTMEPTSKIVRAKQAEHWWQFGRKARSPCCPEWLGPSFQDQGPCAQNQDCSSKTRFPSDSVQLGESNAGAPLLSHTLRWNLPVVPNPAIGLQSSAQA